MVARRHQRYGIGHGDSSSVGRIVGRSEGHGDSSSESSSVGRSEGRIVGRSEGHGGRIVGRSEGRPKQATSEHSEGDLMTRTIGLILIYGAIAYLIGWAVYFSIRAHLIKREEERDV